MTTTDDKNIKLKKLLFDYETKWSSIGTWKEYWKAEYNEKAKFIDSIGKEENEKQTTIVNLSEMNSRSIIPNKSNRNSIRSNRRNSKSSLIDITQTEVEVYNELENYIALYQTAKLFKGNVKKDEEIKYADNDINEDGIFINRDRPVHLSRNLVNALDLVHAFPEASERFTADWKPPSQHGLKNSSRIIKEKSVCYDEKLNDDIEERNRDRPVHFSRNLLECLGKFEHHDDAKKTSADWKPPTQYGLANSPRIIKNKSTYDEKHNEEDTKINDRDRPVHIPSDQVKLVENQWKPPTHHGLGNSPRIIKNMSTYYDEKHNDDEYEEEDDDINN